MEISEEVHFAQRLANNDLKIREKALRKVGKYLHLKSTNKDAFTEDALLKLWKGLFYYFWHTDKPLVQEEKADIICSYIHVFQNVDCSFLYIDTFFQTMAREWLAIDRYRLEKFMMLVRKFLHETYELLKKRKWDLKMIKKFRKVMKKTVLSSVSEAAPLGLKMHISDIYMEELAKVGAEELTPDIVTKFLVPYCKVLVECDDTVFLNCVKKDIFLYLINQNVDEELFHEFPILKFDPVKIPDLLMKYCTDFPRQQNRKLMYTIIKEYHDYREGVSCEDKVFSDKNPGRKLRKRDIERSALKSFEDDIAYAEEKKRVKKKKFAEEDNIIDL